VFAGVQYITLLPSDPAGRVFRAAPALLSGTWPTSETDLRMLHREDSRDAEISAIFRGRYRTPSSLGRQPISATTFGGSAIAAAMIDRLVHHADVVRLKATATGSRTATRESA
jgi:hypothetical protein